MIIASPKLLKENPEAVKAFLSAFTKGAKEVMANPDAAIDYVKARDGIINVDLETRRLRWRSTPWSTAPTRAPKASAWSVPGRLSLMASQVSDAFDTKTRVNAGAVWNDCLPADARPS